MSDEIQYIELRQRDPEEAVLLMASVVAEQKRQLIAIRGMLGLLPEASHDDVIRKLRETRDILTEIRGLIKRHNIEVGL